MRQLKFTYKELLGLKFYIRNINSSNNSLEMRDITKDITYYTFMIQNDESKRKMSLLSCNDQIVAELTNSVLFINIDKRKNRISYRGKGLTPYSPYREDALGFVNDKGFNFYFSFIRDNQTSYNQASYNYSYYDESYSNEAQSHPGVFFSFVVHNSILISNFNTKSPPTPDIKNFLENYVLVIKMTRKTDMVILSPQELLNANILKFSDFFEIHPYTGIF